MNIIEEDIKNIISEELPWEQFQNACVLVTGANGILPSYMVEVLLNLGLNTKVIALVRNIEKAKEKFKKYENNKNLEYVVGDVSKPIEINCKLDYIIHAASQASPKYFATDPVGTFNANVMRY